MPLTPSQITLIETWRLGFVASVCADGTPNLSPKGTFVALDPHTIGFAEMRSPGTVAAITANQIVEVNFVDILSRRGLRLKGAATIHDKGSENYEKHLPAFTAHWPELEMAFNAIITISADTIRPLASPIYEFGGTETDLRTTWAAKIADLAP